MFMIFTEMAHHANDKPRPEGWTTGVSWPFLAAAAVSEDETFDDPRNQGAARMGEDRRTTVTRDAAGHYPSTGRHALREVAPEEDRIALPGADVESVIPRQDHAPRTLVRPYVPTA